MHLARRSAGFGGVDRMSGGPGDDIAFGGPIRRDSRLLVSSCRQ
jgi:hypothetical protein